jgi:ADP-heptose:LPS heptosyltransferase
MVRSNPLFKLLDSCLRFLLFPLTAYFRLFPRRRPPPARPGNILVVKLCCFGDTLLAFPSLFALKKAFPEARLTVLAGARTAPLFERNPAVDEVLSLPLSGLSGRREIARLPAVLRMFLALRRRGFDCLLDYDVYYRFTTVLGLFLCRSFSSGFDTYQGRARFYHYGAARGEDEPEWRCFFNVLSPLNVGRGEASVPFGLRSLSAETGEAEALLGARKGEELRVGILAGGSANWPEKRWPVEKFASLMRLVNGRFKARFFLFGVKEELHLCLQLLKLYGGEGADSLAGRTPFGRLAALIRGMDLFVSNDTGPMHLASLLGVPTVGIFGPTNEKKWSPPGRFRAVFTGRCACRPCNYLGRMKKCDRNFECLTGLAPETVFKAVLDVLNGEGA